MRALVVGLLVLISTPGLCAQSEAQNAVALFKKICMAAPAEWIKLGEADAAAKVWTPDLRLSRRTRFGLVNPDNPDASKLPWAENRVWNFSELGLIDANITIGVVETSTEWPIKYNGCGLSVSGSIEDELLSEAAASLGYRTDESKPWSNAGARGWYIGDTIEPTPSKYDFVGVSQWNAHSRSSIFRIQTDSPESFAGSARKGIEP